MAFLLVSEFLNLFYSINGPTHVKNFNRVSGFEYGPNTIKNQPRTTQLVLGHNVGLWTKSVLLAQHDAYHQSHQTIGADSKKISDMLPVERRIVW